MELSMHPFLNDLSQHVDVYDTPEMRLLNSDDTCVFRIEIMSRSNSSIFYANVFSLECIKANVNQELVDICVLMLANSIGGPNREFKSPTEALEATLDEILEHYERVE